MKLSSISVKNFRALRGDHATIRFDNSDIIFIFGQNNTGKSAVLDAYVYLVTPKQKAELSDFHGYDPKVPIVIEATFLKEAGDDEPFAKKGLAKWVSPDGTIKFRKTWDAPDVEGKKWTFDPEENDYVENGFGGLESHFSKHAPTPIKIPAMPQPGELDKWANDILKKAVLKTLPTDEADLYTKVIETFEALREKVYSNKALTGLNSKANLAFNKVFPGLQLALKAEEGAEIDLSKLFDKQISVTIQDPLVKDVDQGFLRHGHGVVRQAMFNFLAIVANQLEVCTPTAGTRKEFLLLFEEPEVYLHPRAIQRLRRLLYELCTNSPFQFLCASHSPSLIDLAKPQTSLVRAVRLSSGATDFHQAGSELFASDAEKKDRVQMVNRFDPHVCESFFADRVLIVEGDTEAVVAREVLDTLSDKHDLFVLNAGSKNNIPFFQEVFTHFRIPHQVVHDADCRYLYEKGVRVLKNDGTPKANSAWTLNATIANGIKAARSISPDLAMRYVSIPNFEGAHGYSYDATKGKPLSAYEYARTLKPDSDAPFVRFLRYALNMEVCPIDFSPGYLEENVSEPDGNPP